MVKGASTMILSDRDVVENHTRFFFTKSVMEVHDEVNPPNSIILEKDSFKFQLNQT